MLAARTHPGVAAQPTTEPPSPWIRARREFPCQGGGGPTQGTEEFLSALLAPGPGGGGGGAPPAAAAAAALLAGGGGGGCVVRGDALLSYLDFGSRGFGGSLGALLAYLGILHVLCRAAAWALTRRR